MGSLKELVESIVRQEGLTVTLKRAKALLAESGAQNVNVNTLRVNLSAAKSKLRKEQRADQPSEPTNSEDDKKASKRKAAASKFVDDKENPLPDVVMALLKLRDEYTFEQIENAFQKLKEFRRG